MNNKRFTDILMLYTDRYEFRFCEENERTRLMEFIHCFWRQNHVLSQSGALLDWQYLDTEKHRYNFILAVEKVTDEIHGILGFVQTSFFDPEIRTPMRWGTVWKIRENVASRGLGLAMKLYMYQSVKAPYMGGIGLSRFSYEINRKMGEEVGVMEHFYMVNSRFTKFVLADHVDGSSRPHGFENSKICFEECQQTDFLNSQEEYLAHLLPYKSKIYYVKRFFEHPFYLYHCIKIVGTDKKSRAAFFIRICEHEDARCIMIVDFLGEEEALAGTGYCFQKLLQEYHAEYISFYEYGLEDKYLYQAGFKKRKESRIVLPLYYEPFERVNVDIDFHYYNDESVTRKLYFFKGDADQDRPNIL